MPCPNPSTLPRFCIAGQVDPICPIGEEDIQPVISVVVELVNPDGGMVCDPTTGAAIKTGEVYRERFEESFCWCTCPLPANVAVNPDEALTPQGTYYNFTVNYGGETVMDLTEIVLDADDLATATLEDFACGECIPIKTLIGELPVLPPAPTFCDAVEACLPEYEDTNTTYEIVDNTDGSFSHTGSDGTEQIIPVCDLLDDLPEAADTLPTDGTVKILGSDCKWYELDTCCVISNTLNDVNGDPIIVAINTTTGVTTYYDQTGQPVINPGPLTNP